VVGELETFKKLNQQKSSFKKVPKRNRQKANQASSVNIGFLGSVLGLIGQILDRVED
jgi:hypothetical protein